ncbi:MAG TPA: response regulator transcription factor [Candidatus Sulfotelmatobacter sp.]|nr:response regulator transcription factor [Candidatus Sulfotelmatobacter sp.]
MSTSQQRQKNAASRPLVFVVEDEEDVAALISLTLRSAGFEVQSFTHGTSVVSEGLRLKPSVFLLDIMLPGNDGFEICLKIRKTEPLSFTPIIFLTGRTVEADRIHGLELGADDYITKPFSPRELVARVRAVIRASNSSLLDPEVVRFGDLEIDLASMVVRLSGSVIPMTVREFRLLEYLATHRGRVFSRDQLLASVWNEAPSVTARSVDVYIRRLREKIEADTQNPRYLKTLRGVGYRLEGTG